MSPPPSVIRTERLELRLPTPDDVDAVYALHSDPASYRHAPQTAMTTYAEAEHRLQEWLFDWEVNGIGYRMVWTSVAGRDELIGCVGTRLVKAPGFSTSPVLNLYYRLAPRFWGTGMGWEAARAVITEGRERQPSVPVIARIALANQSSVALAEKLGMLPTPWLDPHDDVPHAIYVLPATTGAG